MYFYVRLLWSRALIELIFYQYLIPSASILCPFKNNSTLPRCHSDTNSPLPPRHFECNEEDAEDKIETTAPNLYYAEIATLYPLSVSPPAGG